MPLNIPADTLGAQSKLIANVQNSVFNLFGYSYSRILGAKLRISQSLNPLCITLFFPPIETVSRYAKFTASKTYIAAFFSIINYFCLYSNTRFSFSVHADPPTVLTYKNCQPRSRISYFRYISEFFSQIEQSDFVLKDYLFRLGHEG